MFLFYEYLIRAQDSFFCLLKGLFIIIHDRACVALRVIPLADALVQVQCFLNFREPMHYLSQLLPVVHTWFNQNVLELHFLISLLLLKLFFVVGFVLVIAYLEVAIDLLLPLHIMEPELIVSVLFAVLNVDLAAAKVHS